MNEIVPFGKYRNQPIEVMLQDRSYVEWLCGQDWFRNKFVNIYNIAINDQEPTETPEHNKIQAMFLDDDFCKKFSLIFDADVRLREKFRTETKFENFGVDVILETNYQVFDQETLNKRNETISELNNKIDTEYIRKLGGMVDKSVTHAIEIKPSLGDDYPSVLRQMLKYKQIENFKHIRYVEWVLFIDRYVGEGATIEQVRKIFEKSKIKILFVKEILDAK